MIAGWSPVVDMTHAINMYTDANGAVYKGLAIAANNGALFLYAADFHNNKIDVFNTSFAKQTTSADRFRHLPTPRAGRLCALRYPSAAERRRGCGADLRDLCAASGA